MVGGRAAVDFQQRWMLARASTGMTAEGVAGVRISSVNQRARPMSFPFPAFGHGYACGHPASVLTAFHKLNAALPLVVCAGLIIRSVYSLNSSGDIGIGPIQNIGSRPAPLSRQLNCYRFLVKPFGKQSVRGSLSAVRRLNAPNDALDLRHMRWNHQRLRRCAIGIPLSNGWQFARLFASCDATPLSYSTLSH